MSEISGFTGSSPKQRQKKNKALEDVVSCYFQYAARGANVYVYIYIYAYTYVFSICSPPPPPIIHRRGFFRGVSFMYIYAASSLNHEILESWIHGFPYDSRPNHINSN